MKRPMSLITASILFVGTIIIVSLSHSALAQAQADKKAVAPAEKKAAGTTAQKGANPAFLDTWKQIQGTVNKKRSSKVAQGVETAGVRGKEAEDQIIDQMYYKGGTAYPSQAKIENAILALTQTIAEADSSDPASTAEARYYVGQCYVELGQKDKAIATYDEVIKIAPKSEWAEKARAEKKRLGGK